MVDYLNNNIRGTIDSFLLICIIKRITFTDLTNTDALFSMSLPCYTAIVSYEYTKNTNLVYNALVSGVPQLVYFTQLWRHYDVSEANPDSMVPANVGVHTLCKTAGIKTQNGIMNAMDNSHILFFYGTRQ